MRMFSLLLTMSLLPFSSSFAAPAKDEERSVQSFAERLRAQKELRQDAKEEQIDNHEAEQNEHHSRFQKRVIEVVAVK